MRPLFGRTAAAAGGGARARLGAGGRRGSRAEETSWRRGLASVQGGDIAESGITKSTREQSKAPQELIRNTFPWLNLSDAQWESFYVNRAEANVHSSFRPDDAVVKEDKNILVAWPTKLTLVPSLADKVLEYAAGARRNPPEKSIPTAELQSIFEKPTLARARWD